MTIVLVEAVMDEALRELDLPPRSYNRYDTM
jgi:hypothetical protein